MAQASEDDSTWYLVTNEYVENIILLYIFFFNVKYHIALFRYFMLSFTLTICQIHIRYEMLLTGSSDVQCLVTYAHCAV